MTMILACLGLDILLYTSIHIPVQGSVIRRFKRLGYSGGGGGRAGWRAPRPCLLLRFNSSLSVNSFLR